MRSGCPLKMKLDRRLKMKVDWRLLMKVDWRLPMKGWRDSPRKVLNDLHPTPHYQPIAPGFARRSVKLAMDWSSRVLLDFESWIMSTLNSEDAFDPAATFVGDLHWHWCSG